MADYWKSQPKKFCDFCKCWIADNRPSVEFHEKGKRHKENVEKRLKEMTKQSCKDHKSNLKVEDQMRKMEEAAMKAYMKDVEEDRDFSSLLIKEELTKRNQAASSAVKSVQTPSAAKAIQPTRLILEETKQEPVLWQEVLSEDGHTYYWHLETGAAVWEAPIEGFISINEQKSAETSKVADTEIKRQDEEKAKAMEEKARIAREKMKKRAVKKEEKQIVPFDGIAIGPAPRKDPYGSWSAVETWTTTVDLQLPHTEAVQVRVAPVCEERTKIRFKEKTMTSVNDGSSTDFKKRKTNAKSQRNTRKRLDDDDD